MRISFDIDDTLVCFQPDAPCEPDLVPWLLRPWFREPLRAGTGDLMRRLVRDGWEIAVYTTSYRSPAYLRWFLRFHGVRVGVVVNQTIHQRVVGRHGPSKWPSRFGIDLHVDDSEGVALEGQQHGFSVVVVRPDDPAWAEVVLTAARQVRAPR